MQDFTQAAVDCREKKIVAIQRSHDSHQWKKKRSEKETQTVSSQNLAMAPYHAQAMLSFGRLIQVALRSYYIRGKNHSSHCVLLLSWMILYVA
jgi:hypothetical protein